VLSIRLLFL